VVVTSPLSCELGKWYYPEGEKRYANLKEMEYIIAKHNKLARSSQLFVGSSRKKRKRNCRNLLYRFDRNIGENK